MANDFDARRYVSDIAEAFNSKSTQRVIAHYAQNAEMQDPSTPEPARGIEAVRQNYEQWAAAFSDAKFAVKDLVQTGNKVAILMDASVRHTGDLELGPGDVAPATNKPVRMEIANFLTIENGQIVKDVTIFDMAAMLQQLGLMPSPQGAPAGEQGKTGAKAAGPRH